MRRIVSSSLSLAGLCSAMWRLVLVCEEPACCASQMHGLTSGAFSLAGSNRRGNRIVHCEFTWPSARLHRSLLSFPSSLCEQHQSRQVLQACTRSYLPGAGDDLRKSDIPYEQNLRRHQFVLAHTQGFGSVDLRCAHSSRNFEVLHCLRKANLTFR